MQRVVSEGRVLLRTAVVGVFVLCIFLSSAAPAYADLNTSLYTKEGDCVTEVDPITFVFYGFGAAGGWESAVWHTQEHTGWYNTGGPQSQANISHGTCYWRAAERASGDGNDDRYHVRYFSAHNSDGTYYTAASPHYEEWTHCGHAVTENDSRKGSGFDKAKRRLRDRLRESGHHYVYDVYWGNTRSFKQCQPLDPRYASSNGTVWIAHIP